MTSSTTTDAEVEQQMQHGHALDLTEVERDDAHAEPLEHVDYRGGVAFAGKFHLELVRVRAVEQPARDDPHGPEEEERHAGCCQGGAVVAGAGGEPDRGADPERRRGGQPRTASPWRMIAPAPRNSSRSRSAQPPAKGRPDDVPAGARKSWNPYAEVSVNKAEPTEMGTCVPSGLALAELALDSHQAAEDGGQRQAKEGLLPAQSRNHRTHWGTSAPRPQTLLGQAQQCNAARDEAGAGEPFRPDVLARGITEAKPQRRRCLSRAPRRPDGADARWSAASI